MPLPQPIPPVQQPGPGTNPYIGSNHAQNLAGMGYGTSGMAPFAGMNFLGQSVLPAYMQSILGQLQQKNQLQGQGQSALQSVLRGLSPAARQARLDAVKRRAQSQAKSSAMGGDMALRSLGISSGGREGAVNDAYSDANRQVFDWDAQQNSPEGQMGNVSQMLQFINQGSQVDLPQLLQMLQSISGWDTQRHQFDQMKGQGGILGGLGGLLGSVAGSMIPGGGLMGLFGGGQGNGMGVLGGSGSNSNYLPPPVSW